jgi:hypothetical protein
MKTVYAVNNGLLSIINSNDSSLLWLGKPDGYAAQDVIAVDGSDEGIILLDFASELAPSHFANLLRCRSDGSIIWRAELPTIGSDAYTAMEWRGTKLMAFSWSGFAVEIDPMNGKVKKKTFTK